MCPRSSVPFYIVSCCIKWVNTSWTHTEEIKKKINIFKHYYHLLSTLLVQLNILGLGKNVKTVLLYIKNSRRFLLSHEQNYSIILFLSMHIFEYVRYYLFVCIFGTFMIDMRVYKNVNLSAI